MNFDKIFVGFAFAAALFTLSSRLPGRERAGDYSPSEELFVRRIESLLAEKCQACHGHDRDAVEGSLDLSSRDGLLAGGDSGEPAVVAGDAKNSPLMHVIGREHDEWSPMPPKDAERLTEEQIGWVRAWIASGAAWPDAERAAAIRKQFADTWSVEDGVTVKTSGGLSETWTNRRYEPAGLWAYQPLSPPDLPGESASVDLLLDQQMPKGLIPAEPADSETLLRRVSFNLTGLPPTPAERRDFLSAWSESPSAAWTAYVDRLLASPHYGERMAQHWLDVVRYADSSGFANDYERGNAWRYRDYVIRAFNSDLPYDEFIRQQIAGDEIDPDDPQMLIAAGFLRMGPWELTGMEVAKIARQRFLDDVTNSVGETFLAHSLQCARCHDHKFDPVPTQDYYAIQAVFATTQLAERQAKFLPQENVVGFEEQQYLERTRKQHEQTLEDLDAVLLVNAKKWFADHSKDPTDWNATVAELQKKPRNRKVFNAARNQMKQQGYAEEDYPPKLVGFTPEQFGAERVARKGLERLAWQFDRYKPFALSVYDGLTRQVNSITSPVRVPADRMATGELEQTAILTGGDPFSPSLPVQPGVLSVLTDQVPVEIPADIEGRRRAFARWVSDDRNPLTARVIANRVWMWHFGQPIAGNPNNFGSTGKRPTHGDLLDFLAAYLIEHDWSIKSLHRLILHTQAYRRSCTPVDLQRYNELDPLRTSYAVFQPRRLTAEELRDAQLVASGELNRELGGIPNRPEINQEVALQPRQVMGTFAAAWTPNPLPQQRHRRSIYALKLRGLVDPAMEVFNSPAPDFSCERRDSSMVTPQVFAMFNSRASYERALAVAADVLTECHQTGDDRKAVGLCFERIYTRKPTEQEIDLGCNHWQRMLPIQQAAKFTPVMPPREIRRHAVEENTGEKFVFDETLHANADFVPDLGLAEVDARTRALADLCLVLINTNEFVYVY